MSFAKIRIVLPVIALSASMLSPSFARDLISHGGVLDRPAPGLYMLFTSPTAAVITQAATNSVSVSGDIREEFKQEKQVLDQLNRPALMKKAQQGERAAQVTLAEDFAKEAALLAFAPVAANDALSDAVRWYAMAAKRGFPGAPSLDQAGVRLYPIRVHRSR